MLPLVVNIHNPLRIWFCNFFLPESGTPGHIVVGIRPIVIQIQIPHTGIRRVIPIAEADGTHY